MQRSVSDEGCGHKDAYLEYYELFWLSHRVIVGSPRSMTLLTLSSCWGSNTRHDFPLVE